jgi:hypothetical protein
MRVLRQSLKDTEELDCFEDGGQIEYNDLTSIKVSGQIPFMMQPDIGNDYLRVYSVHKQKGETTEVLHGTFLASTPSATLNRKSKRGSLDVYSLLQVASDAGILVPLTIPKDTIAVTYALSLVLELGLAAQADISTSRLTSDANYDAGTSKLTIVNDLLAFAGFSSAQVDTQGTIRMLKYTDPAQRSASVVFRDDVQGCNFAPAITHELDFFAVPNVFVAVMSNQDSCLVSVAKNTDPTSVYSVPSRGREIVAKEDVSDIESQVALDAFAKRRLTELSSSVESIEVTHPWQGAQTGEGASLVYSEAGFSLDGVIVKTVLSLRAAMRCQTRIRRFVRR